MGNSLMYCELLQVRFDGNKVSNFDNSDVRVLFPATFYCHTVDIYSHVCVFVFFVLYDDGWYFMSRWRSVGKVNFWHSVSLAYLRLHCRLWGDKTNERIQMGRYYYVCAKKKKQFEKKFKMFPTRCWATSWKC